MSGDRVSVTVDAPTDARQPRVSVTGPAKMQVRGGSRKDDEESKPMSTRKKILIASGAGLGLLMMGAIVGTALRRRNRVVTKERTQAMVARRRVVEAEREAIEAKRKAELSEELAAARMVEEQRTNGLSRKQGDAPAVFHPPPRGDTIVMRGTMRAGEWRTAADLSLHMTLERNTDLVLYSGANPDAKNRRKIWTSRGSDLVKHTKDRLVAVTDSVNCYVRMDENGMLVCRLGAPGDNTDVVAWYIGGAPVGPSYIATLQPEGCLVLASERPDLVLDVYWTSGTSLTPDKPSGGSGGAGGSAAPLGAGGHGTRIMDMVIGGGGGGGSTFRMPERADSIVGGIPMRAGEYRVSADGSRNISLERNTDIVVRTGASPSASDAREIGRSRLFPTRNVNANAVVAPDASVDCYAVVETNGLLAVHLGTPEAPRGVSWTWGAAQPTTGTYLWQLANNGMFSQVREASDRTLTHLFTAIAADPAGGATRGVSVTASGVRIPAPVSMAAAAAARPVARGGPAQATAGGGTVGGATVLRRGAAPGAPGGAAIPVSATSRGPATAVTHPASRGATMPPAPVSSVTSRAASAAPVAHRSAPVVRQ